MMKKKYYIVVGMKRIFLKEKEYMEGGFLYVSIVSRILRKNMKNPMNMEELGKVGKNSLFAFCVNKRFSLFKSLY